MISALRVAVEMLIARYSAVLLDEFFAEEALAEPLLAQESSDKIITGII
jgi:hypothetical protein